MGWILLEAAVALTLFVAIVWWTMGSKRRRRPKRPDLPADARDGRE